MKSIIDSTIEFRLELWVFNVSEVISMSNITHQNVGLPVTLPLKHFFFIQEYYEKCIQYSWGKFFSKMSLLSPILVIDRKSEWNIFLTLFWYLKKNFETIFLSVSVSPWSRHLMFYLESIIYLYIRYILLWIEMWKIFFKIVLNSSGGPDIKFCNKMYFDI